ncbi:MAG: 2-hydroxyacyl-CoA dehydratase family protein [Dehalococcoidia bacterium]
MALDLVPRPDFVTASGELCDTAPKTLNLFTDFYDISTCSYDSCHDREFAEFPDSTRLMKLSARSIRHLVHKLQEIVGFEITDEMIWEVIDARGKVQKELRKIQDLMEKSDPIPLSPTHEALLNSVNILTLSIPELAKAKSALSILHNEISERVATGKGIVEKGAPRIISLLPHHFTDPRWEQLPGELGVALISSENGFFPMHGNRFIDFEWEMPDDPYEILSMSLESSLCQSTRARSEIILEVCKRLHIDGVLDKYHIGCRINLGDALLIRDDITRELDIPVLLMEWEGFDPRMFNRDQIYKRFEIFKDAMTAKRHRKI